MFNYKLKEQNISDLNEHTLLKTVTMFNYFNLPETLNSIFIEKQLQKRGFVFVTVVAGELYAFDGTLGGERDVYGEPTEIIINNPALKFNATLNIKEDGVLIQNNDFRLGLYPIIDRYNTLLAENEITMFLSTFNARIQTLISAGDDRTKVSAEKYLEKVIAGELGIIGENQVFDGIKAHNTTVGSTTDLSKIVEFHQYVKASLINEIGLNANFNMKRERVIEKEVEMNSDAIYPMVDNMFNSRLKAVAKINEMYGTNIEIDFGSSWKDETSAGTTELLENEEIEPVVENGSNESTFENSEQLEPDTEQHEPEPEQEEPEKEETETEQHEPDTEHEETETEQHEPEIEVKEDEEETEE